LPPGVKADVGKVEDEIRREGVGDDVQSDDEHDSSIDDRLQIGLNIELHAPTMIDVENSVLETHNCRTGGEVIRRKHCPLPTGPGR